MVRLPYFALSVILIICSLAFLFSFLFVCEDSRLPIFSFSPGYYAKIQSIGIARIIPYSGPILRNPTSNLANEEELPFLSNKQESANKENLAAVDKNN